MNPRNRAARFAAALTVAGFAWAILLSVAPQWHERIHADANRVEHSCAVTFVASGSYEHSAQPSLVGAPGLAPQFSEIPALRSVWVPPLFLVAHIFAHAPPAK
jgi:hypothetical protein